MKINIKPVKGQYQQYLVNKIYRITLFSESLVRVEYVKNGNFDDELPILIEANFPNKVRHKINTKNNFFVLTTQYFKLKIFPDGNPFDLHNLFLVIFDSYNGKDICWHPGVVDKDNLGGAMLDLYKYPQGKTNERFHEGLISPNGYFVYRNICEFLWDKNINWIKKRKEYEFQDYFLFAYGKDYKKAFLDFVNLFGRIPLLPKWAFGFWYSKWCRFDEKKIFEIINKYKELDIPIDVFMIDTDWRKNGWNGYDWNKELFYDPNSFIKKLKQMDVHIGLNDHPGYGVADELPPDDTYREKIKSHLPEIKEYRCIWNDKRYVEVWSKEIFTKFLSDGIDFWWVDGWGPVFPQPGSIPDFSSQLWLNKIYFESAKNVGDNRRPMILSRWGGIGSHKYPVQFSGDTYSTFETLKYEISFTHKGGNVGAVYWSHDIGGFLGGKIQDDLYIRWIEFGCFSPIFRTHSSGGPREPWEYSQQALKIFKKYTKIRYALFPYLYSLSRECYDKGISIFRGLYIEYPQDKNTYVYEEEYLIGSSLLVIPAYGPGKVFVRDAYYPKDVWISLETKDFVIGPCKKLIRIPIDLIPVYVRLGAIIPTFLPKENLSKEITNLEFNIFPAKEVTEFYYYEDDGLTENYLKDEYLFQKVYVEKNKNTVFIKIYPSEGKYSGCRDEIFYSCNVFLDKYKVKEVKTNLSCKTKITNRIFSQTVSSKFKFLRIEFGNLSRYKLIEVIINLG